MGYGGGQDGMKLKGALGVASLGNDPSQCRGLDSTSNNESKPSEDLLVCLMVCRKRKRLKRGVFTDGLAEAVRFELTEDFHPRQFSRLVHSTTLPRFH